MAPGEAQYTVLLNEAGGIRDDLIIYDRTDSEVVVVINAACADSDTAWIKQQLEPQGISVSDRKAGGVLLALQGPEAVGRLEQLCGENLAGVPALATAT